MVDCIYDLVGKIQKTNDPAGTCGKCNTILLQNPVDFFLDKSERIPRVIRVGVIAPGDARHSNEFRPTTNQGYRNLGILLQFSLAATVECASADVLGGAQFLEPVLEQFRMQIVSLHLHRDSQANAHFTSPLGLSGLQNLRQAVSQGRKVDRFLEVRRGAEFLAV